MTHDEAVRLISAGILDSHELAALTTAPASDQAGALRAIDKGVEAPDAVCDAMDLDRGSLWGHVVYEIMADMLGVDEDEWLSWVRRRYGPQAGGGLARPSA